MSKQQEPQQGAWEGIGGPIRMGKPNHEGSWLDPTLDTCCQRDLQERAQYGAMQRTLRRFDVIAERERRRKHLVQLPGHNTAGCRCLYDPQVDGGEYAALTALRATRSVVEKEESNDAETVEENKETKALLVEEKKDDEKNNDDSDDDEFDYLLDEEIPGQESQAVQTWQETRMMEMEAVMLCKEVQENHGYGKHCQFHPRRIASVVGIVRGGRQATPPPMVVLHLYESESPACAWLDVYLEEFAAQARGTLFVRSHGRGTLVQEDAGPLQAHLHAQSDMPALVLIKQGVVLTAVPKLRGFVVHLPEEHEPHIDRAALEAWLFQSGALDRTQAPDYETLCRMRPEEEALMDSLRAPAAAAAAAAQEETYFECGLPGCRKTFAHEHVGITTEQQAGLVVSEDKVLGKKEPI